MLHPQFTVGWSWSKDPMTNHEQIQIPALCATIILPDFGLVYGGCPGRVTDRVHAGRKSSTPATIGLLIRAFENCDYKQLRIAIEDRLHQPYRIKLIPGMEEAFQAARRAASGVAGGAGPSLIAFAADGHQRIHRRRRRV